MLVLLRDSIALRSCVAGLIGLAVAACASSDSEEEQTEVAMLDSKQLVDHTAGQACKSDSDCKNGSCEQEIPAFPFDNRVAQTAPGGFCSFVCHISADCGAGSMCIGAGQSVGSFDMDDLTGLCLASCDADTPCREGYSCVDIFGQAIGSEIALKVSTGSCQPQVDTSE
jgi:hypothetical protein